MNNLKSFTSGAASAFKADAKNMQNKIDETGQDLKLQASQAKTNATNSASQSLNNARRDITDHSTELGQSVQNKVSNLNNLHNDKLKAWFGTGPQPTVVRYRASDLMEDVEFSPLAGEINIHMDVSKVDIKKNYKMITYKAGDRLLDDDEPIITKASIKMTKMQKFKAGDLMDDFEKITKSTIRAKVQRLRAGDLLDDRESNPVTKSSIRVRKTRAGNLIDDYEERSHPEDDELRRLREKNRRLEEELARERAEKYKGQRPPAAESPVKHSAPKRPLGSPKSEFYNKNSVKSPKPAGLERSPTSPQQLLGETDLGESVGSAIRRRIEGGDNVLVYSAGSPSKNFLSNVTTPMEYFSPVKHERPMRNYPRSPGSPGVPSKQFKDHETLHSATSPKDFQLACLRDHEILYEDDNLVIETQTRFVEGTRNSDPLLKIGFSYVNKTPMELKDFSVTYKAIPNVELNAESTDVIQRLNPRETQVHRLNAILLGPCETFGSIVVEYRVNDEPHQIKVHSPIVLTKFMKLSPISPDDFTIKKKILSTQYPQNFEESLKVRLSERNRRAVKDEVLAKMGLLETDDEKSGRFSLYGGVIRLNSIDAEALVRVIIENDTQLLMVQIHYEDELEEYAKDLVKTLSFMCNEKVQL